MFFCLLTFLFDINHASWEKSYMFSSFIFEQQWACDLIFLQNFSVTFFSVTCMYFGKVLQLNILCLMDNVFMIKWPALDEACHTTGLESQFAAQEQWCTIYFQLWSSKKTKILSVWCIFLTRCQSSLSSYLCGEYIGCKSWCLDRETAFVKLEGHVSGSGIKLCFKMLWSVELKKVIEVGWETVHLKLHVRGDTLCLNFILKGWIFKLLHLV